MDISTDFTWREVGARIRDRRHRLGLTQQALAAAAGITQNGVFRLEAGTTNPQLSTLQQVAAVLQCTVRDLVTGASERSPILDQRFRRVTRVVQSGDTAALKAMDNGLELAEALLDRAGGQLPAPHPERKTVVKGEVRRYGADNFLLMNGPHRPRSEADEEAIVQVVRKAIKPFRNSGTSHETRKTDERH